MSRCGLSLLELLAAVCLASLIAIAASGWATACAAGARGLMRHSIATWEIRRSLRLLADDRIGLLATPGQRPVRVDDERSFQLDTCHRPPGDRSRSQVVHWRFDRDSRRLLRRRGDQPERLVSEAFTDIRIDHDRDRIRLVWQVVDGHGTVPLLSGDGP